MADQACYCTFHRRRRIEFRISALDEVLRITPAECAIDRASLEDMKAKLEGKLEALAK